MRVARAWHASIMRLVPILRLVTVCAFLIGSAIGAALDGNKITADGTYTVSTIPGKSYTFAASGTFGGGSLAVKWVDAAGNSSAYAGSPAASAETWSFTAASNQVQLVLSGATDPAITIGITAQSGNVTVGSVAAVLADAIAQDPASGRAALQIEPWKMSGCVAAYDSNNTTVSGGKITSWEDLTGNGYTLSQSNTSKQATWTETAAEIASGGNYAPATPIPLANYQAFTVIVIGRSGVASNGGGSLNGGTLFMAKNGASYGPGITLGYPNTYFYGPNSGTGLPNTVVPSGLSYYAVASGTSTCDIYVDGIQKTKPAVFDAGNGTISYLWGNDTGILGTRFATRALLIFSRKLTFGEIRRVTDYYGAFSSIGGDVIMARGDSITTGASATVFQDTYFVKAAERIGARFCHQALSGTTMASINGDTQAGFISIPSRRNIHVLFAGTNDLANATGAEPALETNVAAWCGKVRAADPFAKIVVCTLIARDATWAGGQNSAGFETDKGTYNIWLRANYTTFADGLADFGAATMFDATADASNTTYYNADKIHPNTTGHLEMAKILVATIRNL